MNDNNQFLGVIKSVTNEGFGGTAYLVDLGNNKLVWVSEELLTSYNTIAIVNKEGN